MQARTEIVGGEVYNNHDRSPRRFAPGRMCAEPNCGTRLSIYNEYEYCSQHRLSGKPRARRRTVR